MGKRGPIKGTLAAKRSGEHRRSDSHGHTETLPPLPLDPPDWLPSSAGDVWREVAPVASRRATVADSDTFANYCINVAIIRESLAGAFAAERDWSAVDRIHTAQLRLERAANVLGLTPASRSRIPENEKVKERSGILELINGGA